MMNAALVSALAGLVAHVLCDLVDSTVSVENGAVRGLSADSAGIKAFLGIPFASPPVGPLRWRSPQPSARFDGVYDAITYGASCYSADVNVPALGKVSENCLTLNIWTGATRASENRPVMIWIYGGGFQFGGSNSPLYNGTYLARHGVVVVTFNYRLGVLGFLGLSELDKEGSPSGNFGLQDQLAVLGWVQVNIAAFGGDPKNVTVFGESAGAHSIGLLLASPLSGGLFSKAIMESGAYWDSEHGSIRTFGEARRQGAAFQLALGCTSVAQLRALPADTVNDAALWNSSTDPGLTAFAPSIDTYVIPIVPAEAFQTGRAQKVPVLAGFNGAEELAFLSRAVPHATSHEYKQSIQILFSPRTTALALYPGDNETSANRSALALLGDLVIRQQTFEAVDSLFNFNAEAVWAYYFTYTSAYLPAPAHTAEVGFVFGNLGPNPILGSTPPPNSTDFAFSQQIMAYWTNFAKSANPNGPGLPAWPPYSGSGSDFLQLGRSINAILQPDAPRFRFIQGLRISGALPRSWRNDFPNN